MFVLESLSGSAEVNDRQDHEDERLDEADEDHVKRLPQKQERCSDDGPADSAHHRQSQRAKSSDQNDHHRPRKDVAEESKRQGHGLDELLQDVEWHVGDAEGKWHFERFGETPEVAAPAKRANAVPLHDRDDDKGHREGLIQIRIGAVQDREQTQREELDPVGDEDVQEERHSQRDDEQRIVGDVLSDQPAELVVAPFEDRLHPAGRAFLEPRADPERYPDGYHNRDRARDQAVVVEGAKRAAAEADCRVGSEIRVVRVNHARSPCRTLIATMTTCAAATPMSTDQGALPKTRATPIAMALRAATRIKLPNTNGESRSSKAMTRYPLIEPITNPSAAPRPTAE